MWPLVLYSNYFKIVSTVTFLDFGTKLISGMKLYVTLYHLYTITNDYIQGIFVISCKNTFSVKKGVAK